MASSTAINDWNYIADSTLEYVLETGAFRNWREEMQDLILMGIENQNRTSQASTYLNNGSLNSIQERLVRANLLRRNRIEYMTSSLREAQKGAAKSQYKEINQPPVAAEDQDYPRWPEDTTTSGDVPCPYCAEPLSSDYICDEVQWRNHLVRDLTPYVCIIENCSMPDAMFVTSGELNSHVLQEHGVYRWICDYCADDLEVDEIISFDIAEEWVIHVTENHFKDKLATQSEVLSRVAMKKMVEPISCPLCDFSVFIANFEIDEHITQHMLAFAFRALPWGISEDETKSNVCEFATDSALAYDSQYGDRGDLEITLHDNFPVLSFLNDPGLNNRMLKSAMVSVLDTLGLPQIPNVPWHYLDNILGVARGDEIVERIAPRLFGLCCAVFQLNGNEFVRDVHSYEFPTVIYNGIVSFIRDELNQLHELLGLGTKGESPTSAVRESLFLEDELAILRSLNLIREDNTPALSSHEFDQCIEPWSLNCIFYWLQMLFEKEQHLEKQLLVDVSLSLFIYKVPTMRIADVETLAMQVVNGMLANGTIMLQDEGLLFSNISERAVTHRGFIVTETQQAVILPTVSVRFVFDKANTVKGVGEEYLLSQIKYRQKEQGPWLNGFGDIFQEWIRKARSVYVDYATAYPYVIFIVRDMIQRNALFQKFLEKCQQDPRSQKLGYDFYLKLPIIHLQQIGLRLQFILKKTAPDSEEKHNLERAIEEVRDAVRECDVRVDDGTRKLELIDIQRKIKFNSNLERVVLWLDQLE